MSVSISIELKFQLKVCHSMNQFRFNEIMKNKFCAQPFCKSQIKMPSVVGFHMVKTHCMSLYYHILAWFDFEGWIECKVAGNVNQTKRKCCTCVNVSCRLSLNRACFIPMAPSVSYARENGFLIRKATATIFPCRKIRFDLFLFFYISIENRFFSEIKWHKPIPNRHWHRNFCCLLFQMDTIYWSKIDTNTHAP